MAAAKLESEDVLSDSLEFLGGKPVIDDSKILYGPLVLSLAPKEGKANTLLADHLFSPALFLAERIERGVLSVQGRTVIELGAGCALPSLLLSTLSEPPSLIMVTDYPDEGIMGNLKRNVEKNRDAVTKDCSVQSYGYEWGTDASHLLNILGADERPVLGYDVMILSNLLHFSTSHDALISSFSQNSKVPGFMLVQVLTRGLKSATLLSKRVKKQDYRSQKFSMKASRINGWVTWLLVIWTKSSESCMSILDWLLVRRSHLLTGSTI